MPTNLMNSPAEEKPREKRLKKSPKSSKHPLDLHSLASDLEKANLMRLGMENDKKTTEETEKPAGIVGGQSLEEQEMRLRRKTVRIPKPIIKKDDKSLKTEIPASVLPVTPLKETEEETKPEDREGEFQKEISDRAKKIAVGTMEKVIIDTYKSKKPEIKSFEKTLDANLAEEENGERVKRLEEMLKYLQAQKDSQISAWKAETDPKNKSQINQNIKVTEHEIEKLNLVRSSFLYPGVGTELSKEEWEEAVEIRNRLKKIMNQEEGTVHASENTIKSFEDKMIDVENFEDFIKVLNGIKDGIQDGDKWYSKNDLLGRAYLVWEGKLTPEYLPATGNMRTIMINKLLSRKGDLKTDKVPEKNIPQIIDIESEDTQTAEKPKEVEPTKIILNTEDEAPTLPNKETQEKENALRAELKNIFEEKINEELGKIIISRGLFGKQIKIKTQHEHAQTRISTLKSKLFRPFTKTPSLNNEEYENAKKVYEADIDKLKTCLAETTLSEKVLKLGSEMGDRGLEILTEEKKKAETMLIKKILLDEKNLILNIQIESLPKRDIEIVNRLSVLRQRRREYRDEDFTNIIGDNEYENA